MKFIIHKIKSLKLNALDAIVIFAVLASVAMLLWLRLSKKTEWIDIRMVVANDNWSSEGSPPQWWYVDNLTVGQAARDALGRPLAEITNLDVFDIGGYHKRAFIDLRIKGSYDKNRQVYQFNHKPIYVGKGIDFILGDHVIEGLIIYIENFESSYTDKIIEVRQEFLPLFLVNSYSKGLQMKDSQGRVLAEILDIQIEEATYYEYSDIRGTKILVSDPLYRNVNFKLKIKTFLDGSTYHFVDRAAVKVGETIWFQFPHITIRDARIIKIY